MLLCQNTLPCHVLDPPPTPSPDTEKFVMVIGGGRIPDGWTSDIELVSLDDNPVPDCLTNLNPFPYGAINNGAGAAITTALESGMVVWN